MRLKPLCFLLVLAALPLSSAGQALRPGNAILFENARLIAGDGSAPIEESALLVEAGRFTRIGRRGELPLPTGALRVDLSGKTVMPALVDLHSHLGYTDVKGLHTSRANYTREQLVDHLRRYAYYGIAATLSMGVDRGDVPFLLRDEILPDAAIFRTVGRGIATPGAGPGVEYRVDAPYGVTTEAEGRQAVQELADRKVDLVKIWVDDRAGKVSKLTPAMFRAIIEEAHARRLRVAAHTFALEDAKELLRAGVDGFTHIVRDRDVDDEFIALLGQRPHVFVIPNLDRAAVTAADLPWLSETLPAKEIERLREAVARLAAAPPPNPRFELQSRNLTRLNAAGVRIGLGTDAGMSLGWTVHTELADMVAAGMSSAQAIVAATRTSAAILNLDQLGGIAPGKSADFLVLDANPLDDIRNTRRIARVYLRGAEVDRAALRASFTGS